MRAVGKTMTSRKIDSTAYVQRRSLLGSGTRVRGGARLTGDVETGENVLVDSNTVVYGPSKLGSGTYIGPNCVIGFPDSKHLSQLRQAGITGKAPTILGKYCVVRSGTTLYSNVQIADGVSIGHNVLLRENVTIGNQTKVGTHVVIDGDSKIGAHVSIQTGVYICTFSTVEDGVFLGPCCVFTNDKYVTQKPFKLVGPTVKKGASIGANALLFPGITVGEGAIVGSQAMVNADVPPRTIFAGIPAKKLRDVPSDWRTSLLQI
jgi:acetyltransferase-like isoleucine patch superfamily enzyme